MFVVLIMLIVILEILLAGVAVFALSKFSRQLKDLDTNITKSKKIIIPAMIELRISLRLINIQVKNLEIEQKSKQIYDAINMIGTISFLLGLKKKRL